jgi:uncharacterized membrane protein
MRGETWVSLIACLIGAMTPMAWLSPQLHERFELLLPMGVAVLPFSLVAGTAWSARYDRRAARVAAIVSVLVLAIALFGWRWALQDPDGIALILAGLLFVPVSQLLVWLSGAIISGRRNNRPSPARNPLEEKERPR